MTDHSHTHNCHDFDVIVIGAGAVGCAIARELSRYELSIAVLDKGADVASGTSGRNSAVVHAGFNNMPGSLMAQLCVKGNREFESVCEELDVPYKKTGKLLVAFDDEDMQTLERMVRQGETNGCDGLSLVSREELHEIAPSVGGIGGMYSPNTAIFDPFTYTVALAENAAANGANYFFEHEVTAINCSRNGYSVQTNKGTFVCTYVVNSSGLYADTVAAMVGIDEYRIYPCRGEYFILDKIADELLDIPLYPAPKVGIGGLGVHLTPTINGNLIIGPSAEYIEERDDYASTAAVMNKLFSEAQQLLPGLESKHVIGNYSGIRPKQAPPNEGGFRDFVIKEEPNRPGFINLVGIESPGLTASIPIARRVVDIIKAHGPVDEKQDFIPRRVGIKRFRDCTLDEQAQLIEQDREYGDIVCRCQRVTKHEIREAIENPLGVKTITGIKYRAWAMTGRCNGGYCFPKIVEMLVRDYGMNPAMITYREHGSELFSGTVK